MEQTDTGLPVKLDGYSAIATVRGAKEIKWRMAAAAERSGSSSQHVAEAQRHTIRNAQSPAAKLDDTLAILDDLAGKTDEFLEKTLKLLDSSDAKTGIWSEHLTTELQNYTDSLLQSTKQATEQLARLATPDGSQLFHEVRGILGQVNTLLAGVAKSATRMWDGLKNLLLKVWQQIKDAVATFASHILERLRKIVADWAKKDVQRKEEEQRYDRQYQEQRLIAKQQELRAQERRSELERVAAKAAVVQQVQLVDSLTVDKIIAPTELAAKQQLVDNGSLERQRLRQRSPLANSNGGQ